MSGSEPAPADDEPLARLHAAMTEERELAFDELVAQVDLPIAAVRRVLAAARRDDRDRWGPRDVEYLRHVATLARLLPLDAIERATRVRVRSLSSVVTSDLAAAQEHVASPLAAGGADPATVVDALLEVVHGGLPAITALLQADYLHGVERMLATDAVRGAHRAGGTRVTLAIAFVDIVGYTQLSASVDPEGMHEVLTEFEEHVHHATERSDVLVTKFIGDAAMLVSERPRSLLTTVLALVTSNRAGRAMAARRAGVAFGEVVAREGDYFGQPVNLAARLTDLARPGTVLGGPELGPEGPDVHDLVQRSRLDAVDVRGVGELRPWRLRPPDG